MSGNDQIARLREQLARHGMMGDRTWREDWADFVADLRYDPWLTAVVFGAGFASGALATAGLAWVIAKTVLS